MRLGELGMSHLCRQSRPIGGAIRYAAASSTAMDPAATIPGDRRNSGSTRDRILRRGLVTFFSVSTPPDFAVTVSASFLVADWVLNAEGSS